MPTLAELREQYPDQPDDILQTALELDAMTQATPRGLDYRKEGGLRSVVGSPESEGPDQPGDKYGLGVDLSDLLGGAPIGGKRAQTKNDYGLGVDLSDLLQAPPEVAQKSGNFSTGFKRTFAQVPELLYGTGALIGMSAENMFGEGGLSTATKNYFAGKYAEKQQANRQYAPTVEFDGAMAAIDNGELGPMVDWLADTAGYVIGQGLQTVATGGVGAAAGKLAMTKMLGGMAAKNAEKIVAESLAKTGVAIPMEQATKMAASRMAQEIGAGVALNANNLNMEAGDIYGGLIEQAKETGEPITGDDLLRAWGAAAAAAGVETATDMLGLGAATGRLKIGSKSISELPGMKGRAARAGVAAGVGAPLEGGTEYVQTGMEQYGAGKPLDTPEAERERINAAAVGAVGGTVMGGGAGALSAPRAADILTAPTSEEAIATFNAATRVDAEAPGDLTGIAALHGDILAAERQRLDAGQAQLDAEIDQGNPAAIANPADVTNAAGLARLSAADAAIASTLSDEQQGLGIPQPAADTTKLPDLGQPVPTKDLGARVREVFEGNAEESPAGKVTLAYARRDLGEDQVEAIKQRVRMPMALDQIQQREIDARTTRPIQVTESSTGVPIVHANTPEIAAQVVEALKAANLRTHTVEAGSIRLTKGADKAQIQAIVDRLNTRYSEQRTNFPDVEETTSGTETAQTVAQQAQQQTAATQQGELNGLQEQGQATAQTLTLGNPNVPMAATVRKHFGDRLAADAQIGIVENLDQLPTQVDANTGPRMSRHSAQNIRQLAGMLGRKVVFYESTDKSVPEGINHDGKTIYVNVDTQVSELAIAGHEFTHSLEHEQPELYKAALEAVKRVMRKGGLKKAQEYASYAGVRGAGFDAIARELLSDIGGNEWRDGSFWSDVFEQIREAHPPTEARSIISKLRDALVNFINKLIRATPKQGYQHGYSREDLVGLREMLVKAAAQSFRRAERQALGLEAAPVGPTVGAVGNAQRVFFEVAPDPRNAALTAQWKALPADRQTAISNEVKQKVIPGLLKDLGVKGEVLDQLGGWMDDTSPSFALVVTDGDAAQAMRAIGYVLNQEAVYALGVRKFDGGEQTGIIEIEVTGLDRDAVHRIYMTARGLDAESVSGHSTIDGHLLIGVPVGKEGDLAIKINSALKNKHSIKHSVGYGATIKEYGYASEQGATPQQSVTERDVNRWKDEAERIFSAGIGSKETGGPRPDATRSGSVRAGPEGTVRASERRQGAVSARGVHYSREQRETLSSYYFGTGTNSAELERVKQATDPRIKQRIYFYVNSGRGIRPESGVGAHAHQANLENLYDLTADQRDLVARYGGDANALESAILDAGFDGTLNQAYGIAVLIGPRSIPVEYAGTGKQEVSPAEQAQRSAYGAARDAIAAHRDLPAGQLSGAAWKAKLPEMDLSHLEDGKDYFKGDLVQKPRFSKQRGLAHLSRIKSILRSPEVQNILYESAAQSGPTDGGCLICAKALILAYGEGTIVRLVSRANGGQTEHYGTNIMGDIFDAYGRHASDDAWIKTFKKHETLNGSQQELHVEEGIDEASEIPDDPRAEKAIAKLFFSPSRNLDFTQDGATLESPIGPKEAIDEAQRVFLSAFPADVRTYRRSSGTAKAARAISDRALDAIRASPTATREVDQERMGPFSGFETDGSIERGFDGEDHLVISLWGKEQIEEGLMEHPALRMTVDQDGDFSIFGPPSKSKTFKEFRARGWAEYATNPDGEIHTIDGTSHWTRLTGADEKQALQLLGDAHARMRAWTGKSHVGLHWVRTTGATGGEAGKRGAMFFSEQRLQDDAKEFFGTTKDPHEAGYILPDGVMLDFSGRHYTGKDNWPYLKGQRAVDHRELHSESNLTDKQLGVSTGGSDGMIEFMQRSGAMRFDMNSGTASVMGMPSDEQIAALVRHKKGEYLALTAIDAETGRIRSEVEFDSANGAQVRRFFESAQDAPLGPRFSKQRLVDTASKNFKAWFAGSAVANKDGSPMRVYHDTNADFTEFKDSDRSKSLWGGSLGWHFGTAEAANERSESLRGMSDQLRRDEPPHRVLPVYLSIKNPLRLQDMAGLTEAYEGEEGFDTEHAKEWENPDDVAEVLLERELINIDEFEDSRGDFGKIKEVLRAKGYDGIVYRNLVEDAGSDSWIAFDPEQIKSAVSNTGEFKGPDIRFSLRRALGGDFSTDDHLVPEIEPYLSNDQLVDLAYIGTTPIRLNVGADTGPGNGFGGMHILANAVRDTRRALDSVSDRDGENTVRTVFNALASQGARLHKQSGNRYALRLPLAQKTLVLEKRGDHYSTVTMLPTAENKWGDAEWTGRLTFPVPADAPSAAPLSPDAAESALGNLSGIGVYVSAKWNPTPGKKASQIPTIVKAKRNVERFSKPRIIGDSGRTLTPEQRAMFKTIGREVEHLNTVERIKKWANQNWAQQLVDQFRPVRDLSDHAYTLMRLSKGSNGAFEAFMKHGKLSIKDGAFDGDTTGGVIEKVFAPLGRESTDFLTWIAGNRAERLAKEGKERLFSDADIKAAKSLATGTAEFDYTLANGTATRKRELIYNDALAKFNGFNKNVMDMAEQSGLIDGASRHLWEHEFYVPFYRVMEDEGGVRGMNIKKGVVRQKAFEKLKGGEEKLNDLLANTLMNWAHLIDAAAKNRAAKATLDAAVLAGVARPSVPGEKNAVWYANKGQKVEFQVEDPALLIAIQGLEFAGLRGPMMDALSKAKHWLTIGVTASPFFKVRNLIRDSIQAIGTSELGPNPFGNVIEGWKLTDRERQEYVSALAGGGLIRFGTMLEGNEAARTRQLIKQQSKDAHMLDSESAVRKFYDKTLEPFASWYNEMGNRGEEINRMALYEKLRKDGMSHAKASLMARDLMDFSMQGSASTVRFLSQVVPFLNARLQGLYKLGRVATGSKQEQQKLALTLMTVTLAGMALMAYAASDEDRWKKWQEREEWDKASYWFFQLGDMEFRIPRPFEIGSVAQLAERGAEALMDEEKDPWSRYGMAMLGVAENQLSMSVVPQLVKPVLDLYANKDSFTNRPIETLAMQRLDKEHRYTSRTSMPARWASDATGGLLSPVQYDHLIRGYFSWLGATSVGVADMAIRALNDEPTRPTLDYFKLASGGMVQEEGSASSRYVSLVYDQAKELEAAYSTLRQLRKEGRTEEAQDYAEENQDKLRDYKRVESVKKQLAKLNEQIRITERSGLDADVKRDRIREFKRRESEIAKGLSQG